jgi:hypothetical protein
MAMVAVAEEVAAVLGELLEAMVVVGLSVVEAEAVDPEEGLGTSEVAAAEEEATAHATIVVKEATLPEIVLTNQQVMQGRAVVVVEEEVRATATTVASLGILPGTAPQQQVPRRWKQFSIHSKRRRGNSSFRAEAVVHGSGWVGMGFGVNSSPSSLCKDRVGKPYVISLFNVLGCSVLGRKMGYYPFGNLQGSFFVACFLDLSRDNVFFCDGVNPIFATVRYRNWVICLRKPSMTDRPL